jgi:integrase
MRGHLEDRGKDIWRLKVFVGRRPDGTKLYASRTFRGGKRAAENALRVFIGELGLAPESITDATVADLAHRWAAVARPNLSPTTMEEYDRLIARIIVPQLGPTKLRALRPAQFDALYAMLLTKGGAKGKPLSPATVHHVHRLLHRILRQGVRWGWLVTNPAANATPPRVPKPELDVPDADDVLLLLARVGELDPDLGALLRVAAVTGARRGELCALRWTDVDFVAGTMVIARAVVGRSNGSVTERQTKTGNRRRIALDRDTLDVLGRHRNRCEARAEVADATLPDDAFIFSPAVDGSQPWRPDGVSLALRRMRTRLGATSGTLLSLRHFAATQLLAAGIDIRTVAGRIGHSQPSTTLNRYTEWLQARDQDAAETIGSILGSDDTGTPSRRLS